MRLVIRRAGSFFLDIIEIGVIALAVFVLMYLFLFQPHQVRGNSMYPNFYDLEYLLTDKISYRFSQPERGEVVIFKAPRNEEYEYIKRVIGLPGEKIRIREGNVFINDKLINEAYLPSEFYTRGGSFSAEDQTIKIEEDKYFVLGDNRSHSSDSRDWGSVPRENIVGKAWFRYWPPEKIGIIGEVEY